MWLLAWEKTRHLATLPLVSPPNDVKKPRNQETGVEIPYWWRVTTQIWVVPLSGWIKFPTWHEQLEALPRSGYVNERSKENYRRNISRVDAAQQNVRYHNTATLNNVTVRTGIILEDPGEGQREK